MKGFTSVGQVLGDVARSAPWGGGLRRYEVIRHWAEAVGPAVARRAEPVEVRGRTLYVEVRDPVWLQQLVFLSDSIRRALNEAVGREALDRIFFRLADVARGEASSNQDVDAEETEKRRARLVAQIPDAKTVQTALSSIEAQEVREAVEKLLARVESLRP